MVAQIRARDRVAGMTVPPLFDRSGSADPITPVVITVPHAGRHYPAGILRDARVPAEQLQQFEDRHADRLIRIAASEGHCCLIANWARAWIDLNRSEREIDPATMTPPPSPGMIDASARASGGLGLIPRRHGATDIWRRPFSHAEFEARIATAHRPWHAEVGRAIGERVRAHGLAILLDVHSMPPLPARNGKRAASVVIGDRHGTTAPPGLVAAAGAMLDAHGLKVAINDPYAGGHMLARHARPDAGIYAIQVEFDRALYLAPGLDHPLDDCGGIDKLVAALARMMAQWVVEAPPVALAAE